MVIADDTALANAEHGLQRRPVPTHRYRKYITMLEAVIYYTRVDNFYENDT